MSGFGCIFVNIVRIFGFLHKTILLMRVLCVLIFFNSASHFLFTVILFTLIIYN